MTTMTDRGDTRTLAAATVAAARWSGSQPDSRSAGALELATQLTGDTKTDTVNRALQIYTFLEQVTAGGGSIYARETADSELERLKVF